MKMILHKVFVWMLVFGLLSSCMGAAVVSLCGVKKEKQFSHEPSDVKDLEDDKEGDDDLLEKHIPNSPFEILSSLFSLQQLRIDLHSPFNVALFFPEQTGPPPKV